jgi:hypothetical protein
MPKPLRRRRDDLASHGRHQTNALHPASADEPSVPSQAPAAARPSLRCGQTGLVADDRRRDLRRMLATGDAAAVVAALARVHDAGSQLAGDALLLALRYDAPGAKQIAQRCSAQLRDRGWAGDEELAVQLDAARGAIPLGQLAEIAIDLDALSDVLGGGLESTGGRIDLVTGEVWPEFVMDEAWSSDEPEDEDEDEDRWLFVQPIGSRPAYRDMLAFIATRENYDLAARLAQAVNGRGAFRRFKDALIDWPEDRDDWFEFSDERRRGRARAWLADEGYRPAVR